MLVKPVTVFFQQYTLSLTITATIP